MKAYRTVAALIAASTLLALPAAADDAAARSAMEPVNTRGTEVFSWDLEQKKSGFRAMEALFPARTIAAGANPEPLAAGAPLAAFETGGALAAQLERFIADEYVAGLIVVHDGKVRLERYALGQSPHRSLDLVLGRQEHHLDPGRRRHPRRPHRGPGRGHHALYR